MSAHRRPLVTAAAAGTVLFALWFVPTAKASPERGIPSTPSATDSASASPGLPSPGPAQDYTVGEGSAVATHAVAQPTRLADTGGAETAPYVAGGLGFVCVGGALLLRAARRPSGR
ncbi:hypothetical protein HCC30_05430 [Streptomyces sp. HNM0574]|nr:hypothetical protein [Streptomyces sp. HNM0574]NLU66710.1 hypothetical protein [Streptomyces sp. HNM0574]